MNNKNRTDRRQKAIDMYLEGGKSLAAIGRELGVSRERVSQYVSGIRKKSPHKYFVVNPSACHYVGLRNWMNKNHCCMSDLIVKIGYDYNAAQANNIRHWLTVSKDAMRMKDIRKILKITGMTFEECFGEANNEDKT